MRLKVNQRLVKQNKSKAPKSKPSLSDFPAFHLIASMTPAGGGALLKQHRVRFSVDGEVIAGIYGTSTKAQMPKTRQRMGSDIEIACARRLEVCQRSMGNFAVSGLAKSVGAILYRAVIIVFTGMHYDCSRL
jgi:hypothetical protein